MHHISVLNSTLPSITCLYYTNLPFHVTLDGSPHQISPLPTRIASKSCFVSDTGDSSEPNEPPVSAPAVVTPIVQV